MLEYSITYAPEEMEGKKYPHEVGIDIDKKENLLRTSNEMAKAELVERARKRASTINKYTDKEVNKKGSVDMKVFLRTLNGLGGPLVLLVMLGPILLGNQAQFYTRN
jgi:hypothetical protein